jgi:hypothetical protein
VVGGDLWTASSLSSLDKEREDFHDGLSEPILRYQYKDMVTGTEGGDIECEVPFT